MFLQELRRTILKVSAPSPSGTEMISIPAASPGRRGAWVSVALLPLLAAYLCTTAYASAPVVHFAGSQSSIGSGFSGPTGVAVDSSGNVYVSDSGHDAVEELFAATGYTTQTTLGGGFTQPNGIAVDASGNVFVGDYGAGVKEIPIGCITGANDFSCVQLLGGSFPDPQGLAVDTIGNVYVADPDYGSVEELLLSESYATPHALGGGFSNLQGVAVDGSGNVYLTDNGNNEVKEIPPGCTTSGCVISLASGGGVLEGIGVDSSGDVFFNDFHLATMQEILAVSGTIPASPTIISVGTSIGSSEGVAVDSHQNIFIASTSGSVVWEIQLGAVNFGAITIPNTSTTATLLFTFDNGGSIDGPLVSPAVPALFASAPDFANAGGTTGLCAIGIYNTGDTCAVNVTFTPFYPGQRSGAVVMQDENDVPLATGYIYGTGLAPQIAFAPGTIETVAGNEATFCTVTTAPFCGDGGPATSAGLNSPYGTAVDAAGDLYIADLGDQLVRKVDTSGNITTVAGNGTQCTTSPACGDGGPATSAQLNEPTGVAVDGAGNIYIADDQDGLIRKVDTSGNITTVAGGGGGGIGACLAATDNESDGCLATLASLANPQGIAVDGTGNIYIAEVGGNDIRKVTAATGIITTVAGNANIGACPAHSSCGDGGPATSALLNQPNGVALDAAGNLYISDQTDNTIRLVTAATGIITTVAGTGAYCTITTAPFCGDGGPATSAQLNGPDGVAVDAGGNLYIADGYTIRKVDATGAITTVAGTYSVCVVGSSAPYCGDGGSATSAQFNAPVGLSVDQTGNLFIADYPNNSVREVDVSNPAPVVFNTATNFGSQDTADGVPYVTVYNTGSAPLSFYGGGGSGAASPNPIFLGSSSLPDFALDGTTTCPNLGPVDADATLAPGNDCNYTLDFFPQSNGFISDTLLLVDNSLNASYTSQGVTLEGIGVDVLTFNTTSLPDGTAGVSYSQTISVSGGNGSYSFSLDGSSSPLPAGLSIDSSGDITGTPTAYGDFTFTVDATDTSTPTPVTGSMLYSLSINPPVILLTPTTGSALTDGTVGVTYTGSGIGASGGNAPYNYTIGSGSFLPAGLSLDSSTGQISGTPTAGSGTLPFSFEIDVFDSSTGTGSGLLGSSPHVGIGNYTLTIGPATITISPTTPLPDGTSDNSSYPVQSFTASGGTAPYSWSITSGGLPAGFNVDPSTGAINGATTVAGTYNFTLTATDSSTGTGPYTGNQPYTIVVDPGPTTQYFVDASSPIYTGSFLPLSVTSQDQYGNTTPNYSGTVHLTSTDSRAQLPADMMLTNGYGIFSLTFGTGGVQTLTATDTANSSISATTGPITVLPQDIWVINSTGTLSEFYIGSDVEPHSQASSGTSVALAFDGSGNIWSSSGVGIKVYDVYGNLQNTFAGGGITSTATLATDGFGQIWVANSNGSLSEIQGGAISGSVISPSAGFVGGGMSGSNGVAIDLSGNVWVSNGGNNSITEIIGGGAPTEPIAISAASGASGELP